MTLYDKKTTPLSYKIGSWHSSRTRRLERTRNSHVHGMVHIGLSQSAQLVTWQWRSTSHRNGRYRSTLRRWRSVPRLPLQLLLVRKSPGRPPKWLDRIMSRSDPTEHDEITNAKDECADPTNSILALHGDKEGMRGISESTPIPQTFVRTLTRTATPPKHLHDDARGWASQEPGVCNLVTQTDCTLNSKICWLYRVMYDVMF